jgi:hypothetical protein
MEFDDFDKITQNVNSDWLRNVSCFFPDRTQEKNISVLDYLKSSLPFFESPPKGIKLAEERGFKDLLNKVNLPKHVTFHFYKFSLSQYLLHEQKMVLLVNEIKLLNLIGCVIKGLLLCRTVNLPHGNLCSATIYKSNKFNWMIAPPVYSRINLISRIENCQPQNNIFQDKSPNSRKQVLDSDGLGFLISRYDKRIVLRKIKGKQIYFDFFNKSNLQLSFHFLKSESMRYRNTNKKKNLSSFNYERISTTQNQNLKMLPKLTFTLWEC